MPEEINLFVTSLTLADDGLLSWTEFQQGLAEIRDKVQWSEVGFFREKNHREEGRALHEL